jgi:hypothetical protein
MLDGHTSVVALLRAMRGELAPSMLSRESLAIAAGREISGSNPVDAYQVHVFHDPKLSPHRIEGQAASCGFCAAGTHASV